MRLSLVHTSGELNRTRLQTRKISQARKCPWKKFRKLIPPFLGQTVADAFEQILLGKRAISLKWTLLTGLGAGRRGVGFARQFWALFAIATFAYSSVSVVKIFIDGQEICERALFSLMSVYHFSEIFVNVEPICWNFSQPHRKA